jgi:hypothetical protein
MADDVPSIDDIANKTFYGFKYNVDTGRLTVEKINDGSPVRLPNAEFIREDDYKHWLWTRNTLGFDWNSTAKTRLLLEVV